MSDKYYCDNCGEVFDEEDSGVIYEWEGEGVMRGERAVGMCCPKCGSEDLGEAQECVWCGESYAEEDMLKIDGDWFCKECLDNIVNAYTTKWKIEEKKS